MKLLKMMKTIFFKAMFLFLLLLFCAGCATHSKAFKPKNRHQKDCNCSHWSWVSHGEITHFTFASNFA